MTEIWITGTQLMERWNCAPYSIIEAIEDGLPCYRQYKTGMKPYTVEQIKNGYQRKGAKPLARLYFKSSEVLEYEDENKKNTEASTKGDISAFKLSKSDFFKKIVPVIMEFGNFCKQYIDKNGFPPNQKAAYEEVFEKYKHFMPEYLWKAVWRARPAQYTRKLGDSDENLRSRK
jgi:hypothetical protein